jgi:hypothetical protein
MIAVASGERKNITATAPNILTKSSGAGSVPGWIMPNPKVGSATTPAMIVKVTKF